MSALKKAKSLAATFAIVAIPAASLVAGPMIYSSVMQDSKGATKTLEDAGFNNVSAKGYAWFACGEHDMFQTRFTATNGKGKEVSGAVCSGFFKGSTIRFD